jgi:hypothetical protein
MQFEWYHGLFHSSSQGIIFETGCFVLHTPEGATMEQEKLTEITYKIKETATKVTVSPREITTN